MIDIFDGKMLVFTHGNFGNTENAKDVKLINPVTILHLEADMS